MSYHFLMDLALILLSTKILGLIAQKFQMPQVVGALIAGLLLSPAGLGLLSETEFTKQLSELGVIVLMFSAGMGTDINELKHSGKAGFMVAVLGVVVPFLMGTALAWGADELGLIESTGFIENIFIGTILTATSVSITVETLKEMKKLETKVGNTILAAALIDDVLGLIALTLVCSLAGGDESIGMVLLKIVGFFAFAFVVGFGANRIFCWMLKRQHGWASHRNSVFAFVLCLVMAYCAEEFFGVADITGAYVAGIMLGGTLQETPYVEDKADMLGYMFFSPIFFATIGMNLNFSGFSASFVLFGVCYVVAALVGKLGGCSLAAKLCHYSNKDSLRVGCGMMVRAEVVLICTDKGIAANLVDPAVYPFVFFIIIATSILAPLFLKLSYKNEKNPLGNTPTPTPIEQQA